MCWQSARRRKLRGKWSMRLSRGPDSSKKGRMFIVWVCLQTHCADIRHALSLFFSNVPWTLTQTTQDSERKIGRFPTITYTVRIRFHLRACSHIRGYYRNILKLETYNKLSICRRGCIHVFGLTWTNFSMVFSTSMLKVLAWIPLRSMWLKRQ